MYYSFAPYEQDFRAWWESGAFPEVSPLTRDFLVHLTRKEAPRKLWRHQEEAVMRTVYACELLQWRELLLNIVTGGGKTAVIGAVVAWLKTCMTSTSSSCFVRTRLSATGWRMISRTRRCFGISDFYRRAWSISPMSFALHVMQPGAAPQGIRDCGVVLGNIQQLYQSNSSGERNIAVLMNTEQRIAVFNDEAHNTPAAEYDNTLFTLKQISKIRVDTTATPDRADGKPLDSK